MKRLLSLVAAVVMVCVAIVIRSNIDDHTSGAATSSGPITIACVTELADQCNGLKNVTVRVEDASITAKAIASGTAHIDGWVTFDPWPNIANQLAQRTAAGESTPVAASPIVIAMVQERAEALAPSCGGTVTWRCLGDAIGQPWTDFGGRPEWGTVKAGIPPSTSGLGLLVLGNAVMAYFGRADVATNDFDDSFVVWRSKVTANPASFADFILKFPAAFSGVGTTDREIATGKGTRPVATIVPTPATAALVVLTSVDSRRATGVTNDLKAALTASGWGPPVRPEPVTLFDPGVLLALSGLTR